MKRRPLAPADVVRAIAIAADTVAADGRAAGRLAASFVMRAAAVEALLEIGAAAEPDAVLMLAGFAGDADALRVAHAMSDPTWDPLLVRILATILRPLLPTSPATRTVSRPDLPADLTAALMGDPLPGRSALPERRVA